MFFAFFFPLICAKTLQEVREESYTNQGIVRQTSRRTDVTITNCIWIDFPGTNRAIWYDGTSGNFKLEKSILIRTSGLRAKGNTISVTYSCGFECQGAQGENRDGQFCWLGHMSPTGTLRIENVHLRACGKEKAGFWATIYAKGDNNLASCNFKYYSTNLTDCFVSDRGCVGYFDYGKDFSGTYLNFVNCGQNGQVGALFGYEFNGSVGFNNINFIGIDGGTSDMIGFVNLSSSKTASNLFFKSCTWGTSAYLFNGGGQQFILANIYLRNCVSTNYGSHTGSIITITSDNYMGYPSTNIIDCIYVDRVWSSGYTLIPTSKFSATFRFSQTTKFFQSNEDSQKSSSTSVGAILAFIFGILSGLFVSFLICKFIIDKFFFKKNRKKQVFPSAGPMTKESSKNES